MERSHINRNRPTAALAMILLGASCDDAPAALDKMHDSALAETGETTSFTHEESGSEADSDDEEFRTQPGSLSCWNYRQTITHSGRGSDGNTLSCPSHRPNPLDCGCNIEDGVSAHAWISTVKLRESLQFEGTVTPGYCRCESWQDEIGVIDQQTAELVDVEYDLQTVATCCN